MIKISKTPLRVSFFGGGSDYPDYFNRQQGAVLGTSINLYIYIAALPMTDFCEQRYRLMYGSPESVDQIDDIKHPVIRNVLKFASYTDPLNLSIMSDVPSGTGLGSSSTFTVGMIKLINLLLNNNISKYALAKQAIHIEHDILGENIGIQDQIHASFGGLSLYEFYKDNLTVRPINMPHDSFSVLCESMYLVYTNISRRATKTLDEQINNTKNKKIDKEISNLVEMAKEGKSVLEQNSPNQMLKDLGKMLDEAWQVKRQLSSRISNNQLDDIYNTCKQLGAYGGKLCGAGAGGFFFILAPHHVYQKMLEKFGEGNVMSISIDNDGSSSLIT